MNNFLRVLRYATRYKGYAFLNVLFNVLAALFSVFSISMILFILPVLFPSAGDMQAAKPADFSLNPRQLLDWLNYRVSLMVIADRLHALTIVCVAAVSMVFLKNLFRYLAMFFIAPLRTGVVRDLRQQIFNKIIRLPLSFFSERRKGDVIVRASTDVQEVEWSILSALEFMFREPFTILITLIYMIVINAQLTFIMLLFIVFAGVIIGLIGRTIRKTATKGQQRLGLIVSTIEESLSALRIIHAFNAENYQRKKFSTDNDQHASLMRQVLRRKDLSSPLSEFLGVSTVAIILWVGGRLIFAGDINITNSGFITLIVAFASLINPAKFLTTAYFNIQKGVASADRIQQILDAEETITEIPDANSIKTFNIGIEYREVWFAYESVHVLQNISVKIPKGKTIALVGQSGAGKSTLADLLPRFYDVTAGEILIDGINIKNYRLADLRNLMGVVTQEPILFNDTIYNNITFGLSVSKDEVIHAAKIANAHEFIAKMENGYDTIIGDRGQKLSGGERQRLTIARAVLKNPPILILDEATSSLDSESERLVQDAISKLMLNRTSIVIAHRLSTIQAADEILVMSEGKIVERGNHSALMGHDGVYKRLVEMQGY